MNAVEWNRDLTMSLDHVKSREEGMTDKIDRARGVCTFPEMRRGNIGLCVATQIARYVAPDNSLPGYNSPQIAWAITQAQLAWYRAMEECGQMVQISDAEALNRHVDLWQNDPPADAPIGYILSLEGADSILTPGHLERSYEQGLRAIGISHYGPGRYCPGTGETGGLTALGRELLKEIQNLNIILDATHLTDEAFWEVMELYDGPIWASHSNCRALVPDQRQFNDEQIKELLARDAVIGGAFDAWMLYPNWKRGVTDPKETDVRIATVVDHIDHICNLAGHARACGIGSDLDGGYGTEQCPHDMDSIADLLRVADILRDRGYSDEDVNGIMHGNWIRKLNEVWS